MRDEGIVGLWGCRPGELCGAEKLRARGAAGLCSEVSIGLEAVGGLLWVAVWCEGCGELRGCRALG